MAIVMSVLEVLLYLAICIIAFLHPELVKAWDTDISVNIQTVTEILEDMGEIAQDAEATELLQSAQQEIMRLARMVGGMLTLASMLPCQAEHITSLQKNMGFPQMTA